MGERVHVDICGPNSEARISGSRYFALFKDEFSSYRDVYFAATRDQMHNCIRRSVAAYKGKLKREMRALCSDRGSLFMSRRTQEFLFANAIHHSTSGPFTPAQNGLIQRHNRTVMECARTMLAARNLPHKLWGEAVLAAVYLLNRMISKRSGDKTPFELVFGRKPQIQHLRVFGATARMKEQEKKRSGYQKKLDDHSRKLVMVGYCEANHTYRLFDQSGSS